MIPQLSTLYCSIFVPYFCQADPYYQHQYHHQYHHHHQYHYPPGGSAPPDVGQYGPVNDANEIIQGDETEPKPPPKKLPKPPKSAFVLFSEFKHEERKKSGEAICKKVGLKFICGILLPLHVTVTIVALLYTLGILQLTQLPLHLKC